MTEEELPSPLHGLSVYLRGFSPGISAVQAVRGAQGAIDVLSALGWSPNTRPPSSIGYERPEDNLFEMPAIEDLQAADLKAALRGAMGRHSWEATNPYECTCGQVTLGNDSILDHAVDVMVSAVMVWLQDRS